MATIDIFKHEENTVSFSAGEVIFKEGEAGDKMYVVQAGEVDISCNGKLLDSVGPGGVLGEMALVDSSARSASATAKTHCELVMLDEDAFKRHVHRTPYFAVQVMRVLAYRLRRMNEMV